MATGPCRDAWKILRRYWCYVQYTHRTGRRNTKAERFRLPQRIQLSRRRARLKSRWQVLDSVVAC